MVVCKSFASLVIEIRVFVDCCGFSLKLLLGLLHLVINDENHYKQKKDLIVIVDKVQNCLMMRF